MLKSIRKLAVKVTSLYVVDHTAKTRANTRVAPLHASYDAQGNLVVNGASWVKVVERD